MANSDDDDNDGIGNDDSDDDEPDDADDDKEIDPDIFFCVRGHATAKQSRAPPVAERYSQEPDGKEQPAPEAAGSRWRAWLRRSPPPVLRHRQRQVCSRPTTDQAAGDSRSARACACG